MRMRWVLGFSLFPRSCRLTGYSNTAHNFFLLFQVEEVIHPRFLEQLLSSEPQLDPAALAEELKQEEALTAAQVSQEMEGPLVC